MKQTLVQYGCGWCAPAQWENFDASPTLRLERIPMIGKLIKKNPNPFPANVRYGNIIDGLPIQASSSDVVYCSHVLEHLSLEDLRAALKNTRNIMRSGAPFRLVLPDLEFHIETYTNDKDPNRALRFLKETGLGRESRPKGIKAITTAIGGNSEHLWLWDYVSLKLQLQEAGFTNIRRASFGDSSYECFSAVEIKDRWINSLGIECQNP